MIPYPHSSRLIGIIFFLFLSSSLFGQSSIVSYTGNVNLSSEFYSASGIAGRRPSNSQRGSALFTLTVFDQIQLPFEFYFASGQSGFRQPFNQFGVSPRIGNWLTLHAGYYSTRLSEYTFGDTRLLGGGVELTPGSFRFSALFGRSQTSVEPDSTRGVSGTYKRTMWGGKLGYGNQNEFHFHLNLWHAIDDSTSLQNEPVGVTPHENLVASVQFGVPFLDNAVQFQTEFAGSGFSNDIRSDEIDGGGPIRSLFATRTSSQADFAARVSLNVVPVSYASIRFNTQWVGPGFVTLGYAQLPNDMFEWTIAPSVRLFESKLNIRTSFGKRRNNLRGNRLSTTNRTIWSLGINGQATEQLGVDFMYSNYGMRSAPKNDTLRIENVSQSVTVSPRYTSEAFGANSNLVLSYSFQDVNDKNVVTSQTNRNQTQSVSTVWALNFPSTLTLASSVLWTSSQLPALKTSVFNISETAGYQFFENTLTTSLTIGYSAVKAASTDGQVTLNISAGYSLGAWGNFTLTLFNNSYSYGNPTSGTSFSEFQGTLSYGIGF